MLRLRRKVKTIGCGTGNRYKIAPSSALIRLEMQFLLAKNSLARNSNSLSLKNTFYWTIANLNFTQSKYCTMIVKIVKFQRNRMCGKFHIRIQFFQCALRISVICPVYDDKFINYMKYNWLKNSREIGLHKASNCPITVCLLNSFFAFLCRFLFPSQPKRYLIVKNLLLSIVWGRTGGSPAEIIII